MQVVVRYLNYPYTFVDLSMSLGYCVMMRRIIKKFYHFLNPGNTAESLLARSHVEV